MYSSQLGLEGLNLDLRASVAAGVGRNLETLGVLDFQTFRYNDPELDITATLRIFPSLTDFGRVRIEFETRLKYEIFKDFYAGRGIFDNFDSRPHTQDTEDVVKNDLGIETTLSWKFK